MFRRALILILFFILAVSALPAHTTRAQDPCAGLVERRLSIGGGSKVISQYGLSLKNQPATGNAGSTEVALLAYGSMATVLDGPKCNYGYIWWQLQLSDGTTGWAAEGNNAEYFMEPTQIGLYVYIPSADGAQLTRYFVTPDAFASQGTVFTIPPVNNSVGSVWQQVEVDRLGAALAEIQANCPDKLTGTPWETTATLDEALTVAVPPLTYDSYPSPDGDKLVLVRHFLLDMPRCTTVVPEKIGMSQVSVLSADGTETVLFPYPQHGTGPASVDTYTLNAPEKPNVYLDEVAWSPDSKYIAFVAAYLDQCGSIGGCYRFHIYIQNLETGQLYVVGEGRHVSWTQGSARINYFRLITEAENKQVAHLYSMRPDGTDRQELGLPGGAVYLSTQQKALDFPWNDGGSRVMVGNAGVLEAMLFNLADRSFSSPVLVPDVASELNRLAITLIKGEKSILWTTIRGDFVVQNVNTGEWTKLNSQLGSTGVAPLRVRSFGGGSKALIEMINGTAYVLDVEADTLAQVMVKQ